MPATREDRTFVDAHGVTIHYYVWNADEPRAVLQIAHGLGEHALRYEWLAQKFVDAGITVYADDHRGHGQTGLEQHGGDLARLGRLGPGGLRAATADLHELTKIVAKDHPSLPVVFLGHSWGSLMGQTLLNDHIDDFAAVVLSGTAHRSPLLMNGGDLNAKHKSLGTTGYEWLSRDPAVADAFVADPLCFTADALKLFGVIDGVRLYGQPRKPMPADVPLLIVIGSEDSLGGEKSVEKLADAYLARGALTDVKVVVYSEARHEVFNETNKDEVAADVLGWIDRRLARVQTAR
jgi:alpha-beta hydrolase superfamily lysophospholipase